jgi:hypothetical protein
MIKDFKRTSSRDRDRRKIKNIPERTDTVPGYRDTERNNNTASIFKL